MVLSGDGVWEGVVGSCVVLFITWSPTGSSALTGMMDRVV
jgi:hypothetical protein